MCTDHIQGVRQKGSKESIKAPKKKWLKTEEGAVQEKQIIILLGRKGRDKGKLGTGHWKHELSITHEN